MIPSTESRKTVLFEDGTNFESCRPRHAYHRKSPTYVPGKYSCPGDEEWQNTSFQYDYMYQLNHQKVLRVYKAQGSDHAQVQQHVKCLKTRVRRRMQDLCFEGRMSGRPTVEFHEARDFLRIVVKAILSRPVDKTFNALIKGICHADGLTILKKSNGEYFMFDWVTDTRTDEEATAFICDLRGAVPQDNRGEHRKVVLSHLRNGL